MKKWRDMTAEERKQHKYETRRMRKAFELAAKYSRPGTRRLVMRPRHQSYVHDRSFTGQIRPNRAGWYTEPLPPHREMERRVRQIERGQLRAENGLV